MNNRYVLLATVTLVIFFFVGGLLDILEHFLSRMILFVGFTAIVIYVIWIKSQDDDVEDNQQKNLP